MSNGPIRRAQLISPFGVGALYMGRDGVSLISAGLDHWFVGPDGHPVPGPDLEEFKITEWRLQRSLRVSHFRMPADFRRPSPFASGQHVPNINICQPFLRFPRWHYCAICRDLEYMHLEQATAVTCAGSPQKKHQRDRVMPQVPFIAICPTGHIQDFPWREWVHKSASPACNARMKLVSNPGIGLFSEQVQCGCGLRRSLGAALNVDQGSRDGTLNTTMVADHDNEPEYRCRGESPWLGSDSITICNEPLKGSYRGSANVYFPQVRSSIHVPRGDDRAVNELVEIIETPNVKSFIQTLTDAGMGAQQIAGILKVNSEAALKIQALNPDDTILEKAVQSIIGAETKIGSDQDEEEGQEEFLRYEFKVLTGAPNEADLKVTRANLADYGQLISQHFSQVMLVEKLRETRALVGFSRVFQDSGKTISDLKMMLRAVPEKGGETWLPAYVVRGEGLLFEFNESKIKEWESLPGVSNRLDELTKRYQANLAERRADIRPISRRLILIHTFAHVLINAMVFECGYNSASLRERLYVSDDPQNPMAGVLIYTASGDSDGTMGGLVRMGKPGFLEPVLASAIAEAKWCAADPICMEVGDAGGQGPDSCNLAACHNCALIPETACELFNRLLDRATLVGGLDGSPSGFFSP